MQLTVHLSGALVYANAAAVKAAVKLQQATPFALPAGATLEGTRCAVDFRGTLSAEAWGHAVQCLQTLAFNAASGSVAVDLPELNLRYEVRAGGAVFPTLDERPAGSRYRLGSLSARAPHPIGAMALSRDGNLLALGTHRAPDDNERSFATALARVTKGAAWGANDVRVWNLSTGTLTHRFLGRSRWVYNLVFSPDGRHLACVSSEVASYPKKPGKVRQKYGQPIEMQGHLFDLSTGSDVMLGKAGARVAAFSHDGTLLAFSGEKTTELYEVSSAKLLATLDTVDRAETLSISFSHDDRYLLTVNGNSEARTYDVATRTRAATISAGCSTNTANGVFVPGTHTVFLPVRGASGFFDAATGSGVPTPFDALDGDTTWHGWALVDEARRELTLAGYNHTVTRWRMPSGERIDTAATLDSHATYEGTNLIVDPRDGALLTANYNHGSRSPERVELSTGARRTLDGMFSANAAVRFVTPSTLAVQNGATLRLVRVDDGALLTEHALDPYALVCDFSPDLTALYTTRNHQLLRVDLAASTETTLPGAQWGYFVTKSPSGARLAGFTLAMNTLRLLDLATGEVRDVTMKTRVNSIAFVDEDRLAVVLFASEGHTLTLVDWHRGAVTRTERSALGSVVSHNGIVTEFDYAGRVRVRDAELEVTAPTRAIAEPPWTSHIAPGGQYAVLTSGNALRVRSLREGTSRDHYAGAPHSGDIEWVSFSPDGAHFATTGTEGTVVVWDAP